MKLAYSLVLLTCALWEVTGYPYNYYPGYGNMDSLSYGSTDNSRGGVVLSRYYNPYYDPRAASGGMAAFLYRPESHFQASPHAAQYYNPDRRRQTTLDYTPQQNEVIPQQNEQFFPQKPETPFSTEATEIADPTEKSETFSTTSKALPEIVEPEAEDVEEPAPKPKKAVSRKKQVKKPVIDEEDDDDYAPKFPASAFFPMLFYGGRSSGPGAPTAIANAYSTGRGGVATSHATAYGAPRPEQEKYKSH